MNNEGTTRHPSTKKTIKGKDWFELCKKRFPGITIGKAGSEKLQVVIPLRMPKEEKEPWTTESLKENVIQSQMKHNGLTREEAEEIVGMYL